MLVYLAGQSLIAGKIVHPEEKRDPYDKVQVVFLCGLNDRCIADLMFMSMKEAVTMNGMIHGEKYPCSTPRRSMKMGKL